MKKSQLMMPERQSDFAGLERRGNQVVAALTGNIPFTGVAVPLLTLTNSTADLAAAIVKWGDVHNRGSHADHVDLISKGITQYNLLRAEMASCQAIAMIASGNDN